MTRGHVKVRIGVVVAQRGLAAATKPEGNPALAPLGERAVPPSGTGPAPTEGRLRSRASATERLLPAGG